MDVEDVIGTRREPAGAGIRHAIFALPNVDEI